MEFLLEIPETRALRKKISELSLIFLCGIRFMSRPTSSRRFSSQPTDVFTNIHTLLILYGEMQAYISDRCTGCGDRLLPANRNFSIIITTTTGEHSWILCTQATCRPTTNQHLIISKNVVKLCRQMQSTSKPTGMTQFCADILFRNLNWCVQYQKIKLKAKLLYKGKKKWEYYFRLWICTWKHEKPFLVWFSFKPFKTKEGIHRNNTHSSTARVTVKYTYLYIYVSFYTFQFRSYLNSPFSEHPGEIYFPSTKENWEFNILVYLTLWSAAFLQRTKCFKVVKPCT